MKAKIIFCSLFSAFLFNHNLAYTQNHDFGFTDLTKLHLRYNSPMDSKAIDEMKTNEFERSVVWENSNIYRKPLLLDGKTMEQDNLLFGSKGILTVVKGRPQTPEAESIPFFISIRSNGKILNNKKMPFLNKQIYKFNLSDLYPFSKNGDVIIIKPVRKIDWKAKRILKVVDGC